MSITYTPEQVDIFEFVRIGSSHGIIDAVAGAGKTTTIMESARFVENKSDVLFCAFNNSIANEIANRFHEKGMHEITVKTIHALGRQILQSNNRTGQSIQLQNEKYRELLKSPDLQSLLEPLHRRVIIINNLDPDDEFDDRQKYAKNNLIKMFNNRLLDINQKYRATLTKDNIEDFEELIIHFGIFNEVEIKKKNYKNELEFYYESHKILLEEGNKLSEKAMIIDFTDMLYLPYKWNLFPSNKFSFLFIDECQDLSKAQLAVAVKYGRKGGRILAVGDPRQSIYGFTGADIDSFNRVKEYTCARQLPLNTSFRCPKKVIDIAKTIREDITGIKEDEGVVKTILFEEVVNLAKPGDLIISRIKAPLVILVFNFIDKNIKVKIHEDEVLEIINELKNIFKQDELNVVISSLNNEFDELKEAVLKRWKWIIKKDAERIIDATERNLYKESEINYLETKLEFFHKKYEQWKDECPTILEILRKIKIYISATDNPIKLSTIHRAKGLENERVFIIDYDKLPMSRLEQKDWEKIQEINLKYVAVTRAMQELFLVVSPTLEQMEQEGSLFDDLPFN